MILFKKWDEHNVKSYIYCINQSLREKNHKNEAKNVNKKQSLLFNFCNILYFFDLYNWENSMVTPGF